MSGEGSYVTSSVYMCDGIQVYLEEPLDPIAGVGGGLKPPLPIPEQWNPCGAPMNF